MATNPFFKYSNLDQKLIDDLTIETIKVTGIDILYIPREYFKLDNILGEDIQSKFTKAYQLECYVQTVLSFDGQADVISKFGVMITDRMTIQVSKTRFKQEIYSKDSLIVRPREGDLVYFPLSGTIFEINKLEDEIPFYQLGALTTYTLTLEAFVYSHEEFNTGIDILDNATNDRKSYVSRILLKGIQGGNYLPGEYVNHSGYTATVQQFTKGFSYSYMYVFDEVGTYVNGITLSGALSGAGYTGFNRSVTTTIIPTDPVKDRSDGDNVDFDNERAKKDLFDFTETDPFSEGKY
jgi:hypothetical protein